MNQCYLSTNIQAIVLYDKFETKNTFEVIATDPKVLWVKGPVTVSRLHPMIGHDLRDRGESSGIMVWIDFGMSSISERCFFTSLDDRDWLDSDPIFWTY